MPLFFRAASAPPGLRNYLSFCSPSRGLDTTGFLGSAPGRDPEAPVGTPRHSVLVCGISCGTLAEPLGRTTSGVGPRAKEADAEPSWRHFRVSFLWVPEEPGGLGRSTSLIPGRLNHLLGRGSVFLPSNTELSHYSLLEPRVTNKSSSL